jgi:sugar/nucleoside kinase (ribokinase family)
VTGVQTCALPISIFKVPTYPSDNVVDPTGAGDVFIGALLTEYIAGKNLLWCACVGSAAASIVVENVGATSFGQKTEIYRRANSIYKKT